ncbi:MAG TPA: methionine--tRNA ligase [Thermoanaerobaculia bacterium]|nr:methionine--tRNA ligase [Thermoanaerobaculia bacterium]
MGRFYVTTPIYYVNDLPHIGHIYSTLVCDTVARYRRLAGDEVHFLTGTDEHGQKIERAAAAAGVAPIELADRVVARYHQLWQELGISHSDFIRTTEERHARGVREMVRRIAAAGDLYVGRHEGWYCPACELFYTDKELLEGRLCPVHERPAEWQEEENVFFRLSRYQEPLLRWYRDHPRSVRPQSRRNEMAAFVESGLRDLSVSRTQLGWGLPFPGHPGHVVYVWLDALTNYVSALGFGAEGEAAGLYRRFWEDPAATRLHLIGKDILRFHAVYWPAFLMSAGLPLPTTVFAHGWWVRDERKISKSGGNLVRSDHLLRRFGTDALRYFLLREMVFGQDASFSDEAFVERYNGDLANGLGNTLSRLATLSRRAFDGRTPPPADGDAALAEEARRAVADYRAAMDDLAFHRALEALWRLLAETNQYLVAHEPWKLLGQEAERDRLAEILRSGLEAVRIVAVALLPLMPEKARQVLVALGAEQPEAAGLEDLAWGSLPAGAPLAAVEALFPRVDKDEYLAALTAEAPQPDASPAPAAGEPPPVAGGGAPQQREEGAVAGERIGIDQFMAVDLRVATVTAAQEIPGSGKLLQLTIALGDGEERTLVAGIKKQYAPQELVGTQVVVVANLEPATLMGVTSQGMVLAASVDGAPVLLRPETPVPDGTRVR